MKSLFRFLFISLFALVGIQSSLASRGDFHPNFIWKDSTGAAASETQNPVSIDKTCGSCHNTQYINSHSTHGKINWQAWGKLNCISCHIGVTNNPQWDSVPQTNRDSTGLSWLKLQRPRTSNCTQCHGDSTNSGGLNHPEQSGLYYSPTRINRTALNIKDKEKISHAMDIHAERGLQCSDCHFSINHPAFYHEKNDTKPSHLKFDGRKTSLGDYLHQPDHRLATGKNFHGQNNVQSQMDCNSCHQTAHGGIWKRRSDIHFQKVSCQACHIPKVYGAVLQERDWTKPLDAHTPSKIYRNHSDSGINAGFSPLLLKRKTKSNDLYPFDFAYFPYNLVTDHRWVYLDGINIRKVPLAEILKYKGLSENEVSQKLAQQGFAQAHIRTTTKAYPISHGTTQGKWAIRECSACHSINSLMDQNLSLSSTRKPELIADQSIIFEGSIKSSPDSGWIYQAPSKAKNVYLFGSDSYSWIDLTGLLMLLAVILGASAHALLRTFSYLKMRRAGYKIPKVKKQIYMYSVYERFWHWLQAFAIIFLLITGLEIHRPETLSIFGFQNAISLHNIMGIILAANAFLSLFYHLSSGEIRQFLPQPRGFFSQAIQQQLFYLKGIFKGETHPFEKVPEKKLNPLQQMAYLGLLNIILPIQIITGLLLWQSDFFSQYLNFMGGIEMIAGVHTLTAWIFAAFLIMHIYLATTGDKPSDYIKAMITGWEAHREHGNPEQKGGKS